MGLNILHDAPSSASRWRTNQPHPLVHKLSCGLSGSAAFTAVPFRDAEVS